MSLLDIMTKGGGAVLLASVIVQIAPIRIDPWTWLARKIGRAMNGELLSEMRSLRHDLSEHIKIDDERDAELRRSRILIFNDDLVHGLDHTQEHYVDILDDMTKYEKYCDLHPDFKNNRTVLASENIKARYKSHMAHNDFP